MLMYRFTQLSYVSLNFRPKTNQRSKVKLQLQLFYISIAPQLLLTLNQPGFLKTRFTKPIKYKITDGSKTYYCWYVVYTCAINNLFII